MSTVSRRSRPTPLSPSPFTSGVHPAVNLWVSPRRSLLPAIASLYQRIPHARQRDSNLRARRSSSQSSTPHCPNGSHRTARGSIYTVLLLRKQRRSCRLAGREHLVSRAAVACFGLADDMRLEPRALRTSAHNAHSCGTPSRTASLIRACKF